MIYSKTNRTEERIQNAKAAIDEIIRFSSQIPCRTDSDGNRIYRSFAHSRDAMLDAAIDKARSRISDDEYVEFLLKIVDSHGKDILPENRVTT